MRRCFFSEDSDEAGQGAEVMRMQYQPNHSAYIDAQRHEVCIRNDNGQDPEEDEVQVIMYKPNHFACIFPHKREVVIYRTFK